MTTADLPLPASLSLPVQALRAGLRPAAALAGSEILPDLHLRVDPEAAISLWLSSPRDRFLELEARVSRPGAWLGLHLTLPLPDLGQAGWLGFVLRGASGAAITCRACLRSGRAGGGFHDQFFDRHVLAQPWQADHHDLLALAQCPELPRQAAWREFILFLPPDLDFRLSLHDLRVFVL